MKRISLCLFLFCIIFLTVFSYSQEINPPTKIPDAELIDSSYSEFYFGISPRMTYRKLAVNEGLFAGEIGERKKETPLLFFPITLGFRSSISKNIAMDIGLRIQSNGEMYIYDENDSLFQYKNIYSHVVFPIKIGYTDISRSSFYAMAGFVPKIFIFKIKDLTYTNENNIEISDKTTRKDELNTFLVDAVAAIGYRHSGKNNLGYYGFIEGSYQISNSYTLQSPLQRNAYSVGVHVGLSLGF